MPRGEPLDIEALHRHLWRRTDRLGRIRLHQRVLASDLGVTHFAVCRLTARMVRAGRLRRIGGGPRNVGLYVVHPPEPPDLELPGPGADAAQARKEDPNWASS